MKLIRWTVLFLLLGSLLLFLSGCWGSNETPTASFSFQPSGGKSPLEVDFDASSSEDPDGEIESYEWNFGDGNTGMGKTATHVYTHPGNYDIELTVTDEGNKSATVTKTVQVENSPPVANLTASPIKGNPPLTVSFDLSGSTDPDGTVTQYQIDFGDGNSSQGTDILEPITHTYEETGTYSAKITVIDNSQASNSDSTQIEVRIPPNKEPIADFQASPPSGSAPLQVSFDASDSRDPDGEIASYQWNFGDGQSATGRRVQHTYSNQGDFSAELTVKDDEGDTSSAQITISVKRPYYPVGEAASNEFLELTVTEVRSIESVDGWESDQDSHFIILNISVKALKDGQYPSPTMFFSLQDEQGNSYPVSLATSRLDNYFKSKVINQNETIIGPVAFEVSNSARNLTFVYNRPGQSEIKVKLPEDI